jgi:hypothetical protein
LDVEFEDLQAVGEVLERGIDVVAWLVYALRYDCTERPAYCAPYAP